MQFFKISPVSIFLQNFDSISQNLIKLDINCIRSKLDVKFDRILHNFVEFELLSLNFRKF